MIARATSSGSPLSSLTPKQREDVRLLLSDPYMTYGRIAAWMRRRHKVRLALSAISGFYQSQAGRAGVRRRSIQKKSVLGRLSQEQLADLRQLMIERGLVYGDIQRRFNQRHRIVLSHITLSRFWRNQVRPTLGVRRPQPADVSIEVSLAVRSRGKIIGRKSFTVPMLLDGLAKFLKRPELLRRFLTTQNN